MLLFVSLLLRFELDFANNCVQPSRQDSHIIRKNYFTSTYDFY